MPRNSVKDILEWANDYFISGHLVSRKHYRTCDFMDRFSSQDESTAHLKIELMEILKPLSFRTSLRQLVTLLVTQYDALQSNTKSETNFGLAEKALSRANSKAIQSQKLSPRKCGPFVINQLVGKKMQSVGDFLTETKNSSSDSCWTHRAIQKSA